MGTRAAAFTSKIKNLQDAQLRLVQGRPTRCGIHQINLTKRQRHGIRALQLEHKSVKWIEYLLQSAATPGPGGGGDAGTGGTAGGGGGGGGRDGGSGQGSDGLQVFQFCKIVVETYTQYGL